MKRPAILMLLVCAAALPAAALAQGESEAQSQSGAMLTTHWSLKQSRKKAPAQTAAVAGPAVPAPRSVKLPKPRQHQSRQRLPNNRTNAAPAIASIIRNKT
jgi:hypothetical protein